MNDGELQQYQAHMWSLGRLDWLCLPHQDKMYNATYEFLDESPERIYVFNCSRRFGKTTTLIIIALEYCLRNPNTIVRFAMPYQKEARGIVRVAMRELLETCPEDLKPKFHSQDSYWRFANGSELHISGVNNNQEDNLRGHRADLAIVDEAGQVDELRYLVVDILRPQLLTTGGKMIVASTPPPIPGHYFKTMYDTAKLRRVYSEYTIYDNTSLTVEQINKEMEDAGGEDSPSWQREYLVKFVVDASVMVIPEWKGDYVQDFDIGQNNHNKNYQYYYKYVGMDLGVINDFTAGVFGHYNFEEDKFYVEGECHSMGQAQSTSLVHGMMKAKEDQLGWHDIRLRVVDNNNPQLINDMAIDHEYILTPVSKKTLTAMVNHLRMNWVQTGRLIIHPSCEFTIGCMERAYWKISESDKKSSRRGTQITWGKDSELMHFDHLAALMYMMLYVDTQSNPIPYTAQFNEKDDWISDQLKTHRAQDSLENLRKGILGKS